MEVKDYIIHRSIFMIPTLFGVSFIVFLLTRLSGSPIGLYTSRFSDQASVERVRELYHLNDPIYVQYWYWLQGIFKGDFGWSSQAGAPVSEALLARAPATIELALTGFLIAVVISLTLGTLAGRYPDSWIDHASRGLAVGGVSTPRFWVALILVYVGFVVMGIFPLGRFDYELYQSIDHPTGFYILDAIIVGSPRALFDAVWHLALPALTIGYAESALLTRHLRSEIMEKAREEYVNTARSKGLTEKQVYLKHVRRNALIPTITVAGLTLAFLMRGVVVVELVFRWPGLGRWIANAAVAGDYASVMTFVLMVTVIVVVANLAVDVLYAYLDPRIELGE